MRKNYLKVAIKAAKEAGAKLLKYYGNITYKIKNDRSVVTEADLKSDILIKQIIKSNFPNHSILSEESGMVDHNSDFLWIIDPLDGSTNFLVHNPFYCVSIGLLQKNHPIIGVVYSPIQDELFHAEIKHGAYLNGNAIEINRKVSLDSSFISFGNARDQYNRKKIIQIYKNIKIRNNFVRQVGAVALELCYVATGRFGAFLMPGINSWDILTGALIVNEAHGITTDFKGKLFNFHSTDILAAPSPIHKSLLEIINYSLTEKLIFE
jgi:myo-inositol-1(or 4)-monophosphatase